MAPMKIYTRTGDDGTTGLIGGSRVPKNDSAIECYGTIDELNAAVGLAIVVADAEVAGWLRDVQAELFTIGAHLATPTKGNPAAGSLPELRDTSVTRLEAQVDAADAMLPPLQNFILPGGTELAARLHFARTVCRRAERLMVSLASERPAYPLILTYVNRLSDWLFVQARRANHLAGQPDVPWVSR
jgi:cob(I)alamin adenosyltransferase